MRKTERNHGVLTMINIRPVSDLRNKFPEIEETVLRTGEPVYLTKNGEGDLVVMEMERA